LFIEVLARDTEWELEDAETSRIFIRREIVERFLIISPPDHLLPVVGDQSRRVEMIRLIYKMAL